jgi:hypothetical protein
MIIVNDKLLILESLEQDFKDYRNTGLRFYSE